MMKSKAWMVTGIIALSILAGSYVHAEGMGGEGMMGHGKMSHKWHEKKEKKIQEIFAQLGLSDEQKKKLEANKQKDQEQKKALFAQMKSYRESLRQELMKEEMDAKNVKAIHAKISAVQAQMSDRRLDSILAVRQILTPEQFKKFHEAMEKRHGREDKDERSEEGSEK